VDGEYKPGPVDLFSLSCTRFSKHGPLINQQFFPCPRFHYRCTQPAYNYEPKGPSLATITRRSIDLLSGPERSQASALASVTRKMLFPEDRNWVLRNLTTKEFVHTEDIALSPGYVEGPFVKGVGFGELVLTRICWSTTTRCGHLDITWPHPNLDMSTDRGVWVGHRFDITMQDKVSEADGWEKVSGVRPFAAIIQSRRPSRRWAF
jgi:hypothetical protein